MTRDIIANLIDEGHELEFKFNGKRYSITYYKPNGKRVISFCEFYKEITDVDTFDDLMKVVRDGTTVEEMLESIPETDIDVF